MLMDPRLIQFLARFDQVAERLKIARATLSTRVFSDGKRIAAIASGKSDIGLARLARAELQLANLEHASGATAHLDHQLEPNP